MDFIWLYSLQSMWRFSQSDVHLEPWNHGTMQLTATRIVSKTNKHCGFPSAKHLVFWKVWWILRVLKFWTTDCCFFYRHWEGNRSRVGRSILGCDQVNTCPLCRADITSTRATWPGQWNFRGFLQRLGCGMISGYYGFLWISGWWFGTMGFYDFPYIGNLILPTDELHHFSEG